MGWCWELEHSIIGTLKSIPESCMQQKPDNDPVVDLTVYSNINYEGVHGVSYHCEDEDEER